MAGIFKDRGDGANVGMFSSTEFDLKNLESAWSPGENQADPNNNPQPTTGSSDTSTIFQDISKRTDEEINVGMFGPAGEDVGAFQSAWDSAKIAEDAVKRIEVAAKKVSNAEAVANSIKSTQILVDRAEKNVDSDVKSFNSKVDKLNQETLPSIIRSTLNVQTAERDVTLAKQDVENIKIELQQKLLDALAAARSAADYEHSTEAIANIVRITKNEFDRASKEFIDNFLNYRGEWDPTIDAYPLPLGGDSVWDINLPTGFTTYTFDEQSWAEGDRLFWYKNNPDGKKWVHLKSGSGLIVTNLDNLYQKIDTKNVPNGYAGLDSNGKVLPKLMPALSILDINIDHNFYERNARTNLQKGDISIIKGAVIWKDSFSYKAGDIVYTPDPTHPHSISKNKFYSAKRSFNSGLTFNPDNWEITTLVPNTLHKLGKEVVYKNKLYLLKQDYTTGNFVTDPSKLPKFFEHDTYIDSGMYILQQDPSGKLGTSVNEDWVSFGSDFRVSSFNGRVGTVTPEIGDYDANDISTKAYGANLSTNVQDFLEELESKKVSKAGDKIHGKLLVTNDLDVENIRLTGLGEEKITNANNNTLLRSGGSGDATVLGNLVETTTIESLDNPEVLIGKNSIPSKIYHEGFRPSATDVDARPDTWNPSWSDVENKPETATRWPEMSEVQNIPDTAARWPTWAEITDKPSGVINQGSSDGRYLLKTGVAADSHKLGGRGSEGFVRVDTKTGTLQKGNWYKIAEGSNRCNGEFLITENTFSRYGFVRFQAGSNYGKQSYINIVASNGFGDGNGSFKYIRIVKLGGGKQCVEIFVDTSTNINTQLHKSETTQEGWLLVDPVIETVTRGALASVDLDVSTSFMSSGHMYSFGGKVYSTTNKPTAADLGFIPNTTKLFSGKYSDLIGTPAKFTPKDHTHTWGEITGKPATAIRWPKWTELAGSPATSSAQGTSTNSLIRKDYFESELAKAIVTVTNDPNVSKPGWGVIAGKPATATRWPSWKEVTGKPADIVTKTTSDFLYLPKVGKSTSTGMKIFTTNFNRQDDHLNSPISLRERGLVGNTQSDNKYAPNLNFHWGGRVSRSLLMGSDGLPYWGEYSSNGNPVVGALQLGPDYHYTDSGATIVIPNRKSQITIIDVWSKGATVHLTGTGFKAGDTVIIRNLLDTNGTTTVNEVGSGVIYLPDGSSDNTVTLTGRGTVELRIVNSTNFVVSDIYK